MQIWGTDLPIYQSPQDLLLFSLTHEAFPVVSKPTPHLPKATMKSGHNLFFLTKWIFKKTHKYTLAEASLSWACRSYFLQKTDISSIFSDASTLPEHWRVFIPSSSKALEFQVSSDLFINNEDWGPEVCSLFSLSTLNGKRGRERKMRAVSYYLYKWLVSLLFACSCFKHSKDISESQ